MGVCARVLKNNSNRDSNPETGASGASGAPHRFPIENERQHPRAGANPVSRGSAPSARHLPAPPRTFALPGASPGAEAGGRRGSDRDSSGSLRGRGGDSASLAAHLPHLPARPGSAAPFQRPTGRGSSATPRLAGAPALSTERLRGGGKQRSTGSDAAPSSPPRGPQARTRERGARPPPRSRPGPAPSPAAQARTDAGRSRRLPVTCGWAVGEAAKGLSSGPLFAPC